MAAKATSHGISRNTTGSFVSTPSPALTPIRPATFAARRRAEPQYPVAEREQPEARDEVVLGAARLGDRHRQGRAGDGRQPSRHGTAAERPGHDGRPDDTSGEREPLHEARETVAARQDVQVQDRELGSWPEPQLSQDVCRVVRDRSRLAPVRDPRHVVRHRVPVVRRRQEREGGGDREDDSHRPERETRDRQRGRPRRGLRPAPALRPEADPRDEGPAHHEPPARDAAQEAQPFGDEGKRHAEQGGAEEESVSDGHPGGFRPSVVCPEAPLQSSPWAASRRQPGRGARADHCRQSGVSHSRLASTADPLTPGPAPGNDWLIAPMRDTGPAGTVADDETST